jgi:Rv2632c-like
MTENSLHHSPDRGRRVSSWHVRIDLFENGDDTSAHAVFVDERGGALDLGAFGAARRMPGTPAVPEIGDEVAAARALQFLGERLMENAMADVAAVTPLADRVI